MGCVALNDDRKIRYVVLLWMMAGRVENNKCCAAMNDGRKIRCVVLL